MTRYEFGEIVLVPFPFTNQTSSKRRPAVVVSSDAYNAARADLVIMPVTSQLRPTFALGEVWIARWQDAGLLKPSAVKPVFATLEQGLVLRRLGRLADDDQARLRQSFTELLG